MVAESLLPDAPAPDSLTPAHFIFNSRKQQFPPILTFPQVAGLASMKDNPTDL